MIIVMEDMYRLFKTAVFQKQALIGEKYWRVREENTETDKGVGKRYTCSKKGCAVVGQVYTRDTRERSPTRVCELRRDRCNTVPIVHANRTEIAAERKGKDTGISRIIVTFHLEK